MKFCTLILGFSFLFLLPLRGEVIDKIVARVGEEVITLSEVEERLEPVLKQYKKIYSGQDWGKRVRIAREEILEGLIEEKILLQEAKKLNLEVTEREMEEVIKDLKSRFLSEEEFKKAIEKEGKDFRQFKEDIKKQLLIKKVLQIEVLSKIKVSLKEMEEFYHQYQDDFSLPPEVNLSQILIKGGSKEAEEKAKQIWGRIQKGEDFYMLAKEFSEGPFADQGGRIGFVKENHLLPEIRLKIKSIKVGEISSPIKCSDGYHIIKLEGIKKVPPRPFEEVKEEIRNILFKKKANQAIEEWIKKKKEELGVEILG